MKTLFSEYQCHIQINDTKRYFKIVKRYSKREDKKKPTSPLANFSYWITRLFLFLYSEFQLLFWNFFFSLNFVKLKTTNKICLCLVKRIRPKNRKRMSEIPTNMAQLRTNINLKNYLERKYIHHFIYFICKLQILPLWIYLVIFIQTTWNTIIAFIFRICRVNFFEWNLKVLLGTFENLNIILHHEKKIHLISHSFGIFFLIIIEKNSNFSYIKFSYLEHICSLFMSLQYLS